MIDKPCQDGNHEQCKGKSWCDCQHQNVTGPERGDTWITRYAGLFEETRHHADVPQDGAPSTQESDAASSTADQLPTTSRAHR